MDIDRIFVLTMAERQRAGGGVSIQSFSRAEQLLLSYFMAPQGTGAEAPGNFGHFPSLESGAPQAQQTNCLLI